MIEVIEARTIGKKGDPALNEDGFVVAGGIAAVVDGVISKSTAGIWEPSGGVVARRALCAALERLGSDEPPCDPADMRAVQRVLDGELRARYEHDRAAAAAGGIAYFRTHPVDRAEANAVVYSHGAGRIWLFGDCQAMVNGQAVDTVKTVDRLLGALRSFVVQAHDLAAEDSTRQQTGDGAADPGRARTAAPHRPAPAPRARRHQGLRPAARHLRRPHLPALSRALSVAPWARAPGAGRRRQCHRAMRD